MRRLLIIDILLLIVLLGINAAIARGQNATWTDRGRAPSSLARDIFLLSLVGIASIGVGAYIVRMQLPSISGFYKGFRTS